MTDKKQCSECKVFQPLNYYRDECKQCKNCLEAKQRYREKNRDKTKTACHTVSSKKKGTNNRGKKDTNELKTECPVCGSIITNIRSKGTKKASSIKPN